MAKLHETMLEIQADLNEQFLEREDAIEAMTLAVLTKEHVYLDGDPGTGKSLLVRSFAKRITGARYFEQVLSKTRADAAVLGPYNMQRLRENSEFVRKDAGFLTDAELVFLDEVWKMSPTLGHDLLAALNERLKHEVGDGRTAHPIPLWTAFAASNEIPTESDAQAAWDRVLLRTRVEYVKHPSSFYALLETKGTPGEEVRASIPFEGLRAAHAEVLDVEVPLAVLDQVGQIRDGLLKEGIIVADRRWRGSMKALRAAAWLRGASAVETDDLHALRFTLWSAPEEMEKVRRCVQAVARPDAEELQKLVDDFAALVAEWKTHASESLEKRITFFVEFNAKCAKVKRSAEAIAKKATSPRTKAEVGAFLKEVDTQHEIVKRETGVAGLTEGLT